MNKDKQHLLLELLISSPDTFALCQNIVKSDYFDPSLRNAVAFVKDYYDKYSSLPTPTQIKVESSIDTTIHTVTSDNIKYCAEEVETFCKNKAMEAAILASPELLEKGDHGAIQTLVKEALEVSLTKDLGVDYFNTVEERLLRMEQNPPMIPTGWARLDDLLDGGLGRQELLLCAANSGEGKSITLANLSLNTTAGGYNTLYITLELSQDVVSSRFDKMFTGFGRQETKDNKEFIINTVNAEGNNHANLIIKQMSQGSTANDIRAYLKEYELKFNHTPDVFILDYLDEMNPIEKVSADNISEKDKRVSQQLRSIGVDFNMAVASASQLNRTAVGKEKRDHSNIAGGMGKISVSDVYFSILFTDEVKAAGDIIWQIEKTRNSGGVGNQTHQT